MKRILPYWCLTNYMKGRFKKMLPLLIVPLVVVLLLAFSGSWLLARKLVANLILPIGWLWLAGLTALVWPGLKRQVRVLIGVVWVVFSLAGNGLVAEMLLRPLESPYFANEVIEEKMDALVVLGGGSARTPLNELPAAGPHGDRLIRAARLYHEGKVGMLIATGQNVFQTDKSRSLASDTSQIWQDLGIPKGAILELPEPSNTAQEMAAVAALVEEYPEWKRIGVCSSAFHLNRGLKEARKHGLDPVAVPSDFRSGAVDLESTKFSTIDFLPQGGAFRNVHVALWEYLGALL